MKTNRSLFFLSVWVSSYLLLFAATAETSPSAKEYVTVGKIKAVQLKAGTSHEVVIPATVLPGHHIQANPATLPNLIATEIAWEPVEGLEVGKILYPKSKPWRLTSAGKVIQTYEGLVEFKVNVSSKSLKPGTYELKGSLRYQACDEKNCFFPTAAPLKVSLSVAR